MPPPSTPTGLSRISNLTPLNGSIFIPKVFLFALIVATCIRLAVLHCTRRKRKKIEASQIIQEKARIRNQVIPSHDPKQYQNPEPQPDHIQPPPSFRPIYPWISPPQLLPGPYDPRMYPLPTIRRHSYHSPLSESEAETNSISYTRRVSTNSIPARHSTFQGTVTTSSNGSIGWRRNQWVVSGG
ncbi:hypothetical protein CC78DRAFT_38306 [Lojkania enalia]|uniref:Transmembrane protein n=1 Tax=Lojkania enalia TaxID=147567 RepID=A0A9P4K2L3_9PLEO|nr:hypothetical protein CC78DRAFT_38306 [Didymosphaeria enalia]